MKQVSIYIIILLGILLYKKGVTQDNVYLYANNASDSVFTAYDATEVQDYIYVFCNNNSAQLSAHTNIGDVAVFEWTKFNPQTNQFEYYNSEHNISSTIANLEDGAYNVNVFDLLGVQLGCKRAWVFTNKPDLTISKLPEICGPFLLNVNIDHKDPITYYNPPADPITINENTEITICFTAKHAYVSDLGFYLVGPEVCGSPRIKLMEAFAISQSNDLCNNGDDVVDLCFSNTSNNYYTDPCHAPTPLTGTYGFEEDWTSLYGCQANASGWKVQIYDCIDGDVGELNHAQILFSTNINSCRNIAINYDSGDINQGINDNSCTPEKASTFEVETTAAKPKQLENPAHFVWTENAPFFELDNNGFGKSIFVPRPPKTETVFEITATDTFGCVSTSQLVYNFVPNNIPEIKPIPTICKNYDIVQFVASPPHGKWAGNGIVDETNGLFNPNLVNDTLTRIFYTDTSMCGGVTDTYVPVYTTPDFTIIGKSPVCDYHMDGELNLATTDTGYWYFNWTDNNWQIIANGDNANNNLDNLSIGMYHAIINFSNTCIDTAHIDFTSKQTADVSIVASTIETSVEVPIINFTGFFESPLVYSEFLVNGTPYATNTDVFTHEFKRLPQTHIVSYVGKDNLNCFDTANVSVDITHEFNFFVPNTFTPNNDGLNDYLQVFANDLNVLDYQFEVVNRWGDRVFYSHNINDKWDGTFEGKNIPAGRYLYHVSGKSKTTGQITEFTDFVFVLY